MSEDLLTLDGVTVAYEGAARAAVSDFNLTVRRGELVSLLGPSGCGKTTTMRAVAGLTAPRSGRITLAGRDVTRVPANRRGVGLVFQSYALFPHLSVFENVAFGLRLKGVRGAELKRRVDRMLGIVSLAGFEGRLPDRLSGGQRQRTALARALAVEPQLLLLDEPLSNLDARLRLEMRAELRRLQRETGATMVYVTHDQAEALALSDRIVVMQDGRIEQEGRPEDLYHRPRTPFAARFMGFENVFGVEAGRLRCADGRMIPFFGHAPEDIAWLAWRSRGVKLGSGPYQGRVFGASYQGETVEYLLESPLGSIKAEGPAPQAAWEGETLAFDLPIETAALITL